jgi:transcriptional regulator with XRE-family HTH domain
MDFRTLRETRGLTNAELARLSGVNNVTISQIEGGRIRSPTIWTVCKLADVLGVTAEVVANAIAETKVPA